MKKAKIISMMLLPIFIIGCSQTGSSSKSNDIIKANIDQLTISAMQSFNDDDDATAQWEEYMSDKYNFNVDVEEYNIAIAALHQGTYSGLINTNSPEILTNIKNGSILPLDDYLKDNRAWNALPDYFRKLFEYEGHIWAIPTSFTNYGSAITIRTDWLEKVGAGIPTTIEDFMITGEKIHLRDANGDGDYANDYILGGSLSMDLNMFFQSLGIYSSSGTSIAYDPTMGCIVDSLFKDSSSTALQSLRTMVLNGLIDPSSFVYGSSAGNNNLAGLYGVRLNSFFTTGRYGVGIELAKGKAKSELGHELDINNEEDYKYATSIYELLPPLSKEYPITYQTGEEGFVLSANTKNPKETINAFVDMIYSYRKGFLDFYLGTPENYTIKSDNTIVLNYADKEAKTQPVLPMLLSYLSIGSDIGTPQILFGDSFVVLMQQDGDLMQQYITRANEKRKYENDYITRYTKTGQLVRVSGYYRPIGSSTSFEKYMRQLRDEYQRVFSSLSDENLTINQILAEYRNNVKEYVTPILDESNTYLNLPNKQKLE